MPRLENSTMDVLAVYKKIENMRKKYGEVKKAEIHFHTPASYDYKLISSNAYYKNLCELEIIEFAFEIGYLSETQKNLVKQTYIEGKYSSKEYQQELLSSDAPYENFKEYLTYNLIAYKFYLENIEIAIITDHNTIQGFPKLKYALSDYYKKNIKNKSTQKPVQLLLGVEITCSDCNHIVGIFDEKDYELINTMLKEIIHDEVSGTVENTFTTLNIIEKNGGIGYIAHINTYNGLGTKLYKEKLFNLNLCKILGTTNLTAKGWKSKIPFYFDETKVCFLYESDAHTIDEIGIKNTWIKMNKISFDALKIALKNHSFCIFHDKPSSTPIFVKGICIKPNEKSFLRGRKPTEEFIVDFSKDLNCIIGGRGTGKSTILNILDTVFTQEINSLDKLKVLSLYEFIYVVFRAHKKDYIIRFLPQINEHLDVTRSDFFTEKAFQVQTLTGDSNIKLTKNWYDLFELPSPNSPPIQINNTLNIEVVLSNIYKKHYSINNIVNLVQQRNLGDFIKTVIHAGITNDDLETLFLKLKKSSTREFNKNLKLAFNNIKPQLDLIKENSKRKIDNFNKLHKDLIQIEFAPKISDKSLFLQDIFKYTPLNQYISNTKLKWIDAISYVEVLVEKLGYVEFLDILIKRQFKQLNAIESIQNYVSEELTVKDIENGFVDIKNISIGKLFSPILNLFRTDKYVLISSLEKYIQSLDDYSLTFNVHSKESIQTLKSEFIKIENLSLGQQVVAILTFIMEYGKYTNDFTPFIIDQPEDNLDNQYIYNTLVASLKKIKNHRQVIIVTHNSTIVTNADAEQVIVLESDGINGYIKKTGYLSDSKIMKLILVHLEGGENAFTDKHMIYSTVLK